MTEIKLHNTATRRKEVFTPIDRDNVRMYVCGPTVYDRAHLGNARPVVVFDVLFRLLRHVYGADAVTYVRNFTDVEDKINDRAKATGRPITDITDETIQWYHDDMDALGTLRPTHEPRATAYIPQMVAMIETLIAKGVAYVAEGHVLFGVDDYANYGQLSGRSVEDMIAGARVEVAPYKKNSMDFVLWKPSSDDLPGWDSPWGRGRPGWHIECSAMAKDLLGESFDIHAGGIDLAFPHHENEIAQSKCACGEDSFAKVWLHNEMLQVEGKKMSKSLGNFFTVRDLLDQGVPGEVIRFVMLSTHYRKPMDWTERAKNSATLFLKVLAGLDKVAGTLESAPPDEIASAEKSPSTEIVDALADDLNTSLALKIFRDLVKSRGEHNKTTALQTISDARILGFLDGGTQVAPDVAHRVSLDGFNVSSFGISSVNLQNEATRLARNWMILRQEEDWAAADKWKERAGELGLKLSVGKSPSGLPEVRIDRDGSVSEQEVLERMK